MSGIEEELESFSIPDLPYNLKRAVELIKENSPPPKIDDKKLKSFDA
jgi:hypothetical protein